VLDLSVLLFLLSMMVVGGLGRAWGPLLGCALLMLIDEVLKDFGEWRMIGLGAITVVFIMVLRQGVVGLIAALWAKLHRGGAVTAPARRSASLG
jgi:branched-chain amino acid transport system permease protein